MASVLDRLHAMLAKAGVTDEEIINGFRLTDKGNQKAAAILGIAPEEVRLLIGSLTTQLRHDHKQHASIVNEFSTMVAEGRFEYEPDYLGNVTVRDTKTGKEVFLRGDAAADLLSRVEGSDDQQAALADFQHMMEDIADHEADHYRALAKTGFYGRQGAGCIILAHSTGRILLAKRSRAVEQPGTWGGWGGAIDGDENPLDAVKREVREEAGYTGPVDVRPLLVFRKGTFAYHNFLVVVEDEFRPMLNWETEGYRWCDYGNWPSPLHFGLESLFSDADSVATITHELERLQNTVKEVIGEGFDDDTLNTAFFDMMDMLGFHETMHDTIFRSLMKTGSSARPLTRTLASWTPLQWNEAAQALKPHFDLLAAGGQVIISLAQPMSEEVLDEAEDDMDIAITAQAGTYNFPFDIGAVKGLATARYNGSGPSMKVTLIDTRDMAGDPVELDPQDQEKVRRQAVNFIGRE